MAPYNQLIFFRMYDFETLQQLGAGRIDNTENFIFRSVNKLSTVFGVMVGESAVDSKGIAMFW